MRITAVSILLVMISTIVFAQTIENTKLPYSGEFVFIPMDKIPLPHPRTNLNLTVGLNRASNVAFGETVIDSIGVAVFEGDLFYGELGFDYNQKIKDWISFRLRYNLSTRLGQDVQGLLSQGITSLTTAELSWKIKLVEGKKTFLSAIAGLNNNSASVVDVIGWAEDLVNGNPNTSISRSSSALTGEAGLVFAWGISKVFGLHAEGTFEFGEDLDQSDADSFWKFSLVGHANFYARYNVPLGVALGYTVTNLPEVVLAADRNATSLVVKLAYTGSDDFNVGLELNSTRLPLRRVEEKGHYIGVTINGRYYF